MAPTTVNELANLSISFGFATDGVTPEDIITIVIDGVNYPVTYVFPANTTSTTMQNVVDIINNDPVVGPLITAAIEMGTTAPVLTLRGKSVTTGVVGINNDLTFIVNWSLDNVVQDISGVTTDLIHGSTPATSVKMLEPKPADPIFDKVYIPHHTEVVSDELVLDINYWANLKYDTLDNANSVTCSVVAAKHPETNVDIVYIAYINYADVLIEARYANGAESGQLVPDLTGNEIGFQPLPNGWIDTYWTNPRVLSTTLAYDSVTGRLFLKSIVSGAIYAESAYVSVNTSVLSICELDPMLSTQIQWVHTTAHDPIQSVPVNGFGVFQRSDGGFIIDHDHNLIAASNVLIPVVDSYYGTQSFAPGVEITKLTPSGSLLWTKMIETGRYFDPVIQDSYNIPYGDYNNEYGRHFDMPANVAVSATNDIFVAHGTCFHKITTDGSPVWTKEFDQLSLGRPNDGVMARLVTDIQVHPTTGNVYVALSGVQTMNNSNAVIVRFEDNAVGEMSPSTGITWLSGVKGTDAELWSNAVDYRLYVPVSLKLDVASNRLFAAAKLTQHGNGGYTAVAAGDMTVVAIDATTMGIQWSSDVSILSVNTTTDLYLNGPMGTSNMWDRQNFGYTTFDFIRDINNTTTGVCYGAPLYIGEGGQGTISPGGLVVAQNVGSTTVATNASDAQFDNARYKFESFTSYDVDAHVQIVAQAGNDVLAVYNGIPLIADNLVYSTWHRTEAQTTLTNIAYVQYTDYSWILPPTAAYNTTSLYVRNIAEVGELILNGAVPPPTSLVGNALDRQGAFRASADGVYYCSADYDGATPVWKTLPFGATGGRLKLDPICYNPNTSALSGCPSDQVGDVYVMDNVVFYCTGTYDGTNGIWDPVLPMIGTGLGITTSINTAYDPSNPALWPTNYYMNSYPVTIYAAQTTAAPNQAAIYNQYTYLTSADPHGRNYASNVSFDSYIYLNESYWMWPAGYTITITNATSATNGTYIQLIPPSGAIFMNGVSPYVRAGESITLQRSPTDSGTWIAISRQSPIRTITANANAGLSIDPRRSYRYKITMNTNYTVPYPPAYSPIDGEQFTISVYNNVTAYTCSWNSSYRWAGGTAPAALASNRMHIVTFTYMATGGFWVGTVVAQNVPIV